MHCTETQRAPHRPRSLPTAVSGVFPESRVPCWEPLPSNVLEPATDRPGSQEAPRVQTEDGEGAVLRPWLSLLTTISWKTNAGAISRAMTTCALCRAPDQCCHLLCHSIRDEAWYSSFLNGKLRLRVGKQHTQVTPVLWGHFVDHLKGTLERTTFRKPPSPSPKLCCPLGPSVPDFYFLCSPQFGIL